MAREKDRGRERRCEKSVKKRDWEKGKKDREGKQDQCIKTSITFLFAMF